MNIRVKLFATLREGRGKALEVDAQDGASAGEILRSLMIKAEDVAILLINGKDGHLDQPLFEDDLLSIFPPVGGG